MKTALAIIVAVVWVDYYFEKANPIGRQIETLVTQQVMARHTPFLTYNEIPSVFRNAVIATEDRTFFSNPGIDPASILRSLVVDVENGQYTQGGSTITQQLVRNALPITDKKTLTRKLVEAMDAIGVTHDLSKQQIFTLYVNDVYYGQDAYGLYDAAEAYFGIPPQALNSGELTLLAGLPNAPSAYDPIQALNLARDRQKVVVRSMVHGAVISSAEAKQILSEPIRLKKA